MDSDAFSLVAGLLCLAWYVIYIIQMFLSYGIAYRKTKAGGDNGVALFGWLIVYLLASFIPVLVIVLWKNDKKKAQMQARTQVPPNQGFYS